MEILTHALIALTLARAGQKILPRYGATMLVVSGVAADLDFLSYLGGPSAYLRFHRGVLHSVLGSCVLVCALALAFWVLGRRLAAKNLESNLPRLRFVVAIAVCGIGVVGHLLFDLASGIGVQLLWPFRQKWTAWDLVSALDPWILIVLFLGLALPEVWRLVSEEIGERKSGPRGWTAAIVTLLALLIYFGARAGLHSRAVDELNAREFHGAPALSVGAFPSSISPLDWRGVVSTDNDIEVIEVSLAPGAGFDPERAVRYYKPEDSAALEAAQNTAAANTFVRYARFPLASLEREDEGYRFTLRDLRFAAGEGGADNIFVTVELGTDMRVVSEEFRYANSAAR
ncbi:MAG: metal-dependent hydrolase [Candidatus Acidiferrales bacterium]